MPYWVYFNDKNRTLYGFPNQTGTYGVDIVFTDEVGEQAYVNLMIYVDEEIQLTDTTRGYVLASMAFWCLLLYYSYVILFGVSLIPKDNKA